MESLPNLRLESYDINKIGKSTKLIFDFIWDMLGRDQQKYTESILCYLIYFVGPSHNKTIMEFENFKECINTYINKGIEEYYSDGTINVTN